MGPWVGSGKGGGSLGRPGDIKIILVPICTCYMQDMKSLLLMTSEEPFQNVDRGTDDGYLPIL